MNICFIGGGNMASAMIGGLLLNGTCRPADIRVVEPLDEARQRVAAQGVAAFAALDAGAVANADIAVLAVKPQQMKAVATTLGPLLAAGQAVLSIAAGIRLDTLEQWLGNRNAGFVTVRAMPNTPALVGAGMTGLYGPARLSNAQRQRVEEVVRATGDYVWVDAEPALDAVTAVSGSGPAYFFYFIEALEQAGMELGLPRQTARKLALETAYGAAKLARESTEDPATLRARVTSKNGTTERALLSMEANSVKQHIIEAARAAAARANEMGDELGGA
ncbi:MAG TPA: pyrroline-5-carboxylate reductase [Gallionellaceae bacterium]|nr:pyrroline-5-carboxylate reductase [Gallionellaceae bacterium]